MLRKKFDLWSYSGVITRKKIGEYYHHHASGVLPYITDSVLNLENPEISRPHFRRSEIPEKNIISNSWSIFLSRGIEYFLRLKKPLKIDNVDILDKINDDLNIYFDYCFRIRLLYAQKLATDFLLALGKKPKVVVMECPYDQMGYVWSFHSHSIPVIELQHGVINANHYAYNSAFHGGILSPDILCVYGEEEYKFITNRYTPYCPKVIKTGLFILDESNKYFKDDIFKDLRGKYKNIIVVAGQSDCEESLLRFIEETSHITPDNLYIYIPRRVCNLNCNSDNVIIKFNVNIYQYIKWCDIHCTVSSTTCLESQYFEKPNIFVEINNTAKKYYEEILKEENGSYFVNCPEKFRDVCDVINNNIFIYRDLFARGTVENVRKVINKFLLC